MNVYGQDPITFLSVLTNADTCQVSYPRAIKEEFNFDIWQTLP